MNGSQGHNMCGNWQRVKISRKDKYSIVPVKQSVTDEVRNNVCWTAGSHYCLYSLLKNLGNLSMCLITY